MIKHVIRDKNTGKFYAEQRNARRAPDWTDIVRKARFYDKLGHAKGQVTTMLPYWQAKKEDYEILELHFTIAEVIEHQL